MTLQNRDAGGLALQMLALAALQWPVLYHLWHIRAACASVLVTASIACMGHVKDEFNRPSVGYS